MKPLGRRHYKDKTGGKHTYKRFGKDLSWWLDLIEPSTKRFRQESKRNIKTLLRGL